jgi:hypothetical protein
LGQTAKTGPRAAPVLRPANFLMKTEKTRMFTCISAILGLQRMFICFIVAFIFDIVAVSKNSHIFSSDDSNQAIPRIISTAIMIPFAIYEIANIGAARETHRESDSE